MAEALMDIALGLNESVIGTIVMLAVCLAAAGIEGLWNRCRSLVASWQNQRRSSQLAAIVAVELDALNTIHRINYAAWTATQAMQTEARIRQGDRA